MSPYDHLTVEQLDAASVRDAARTRRGLPPIAADVATFDVLKQYPDLATTNADRCDALYMERFGNEEPKRCDRRPHAEGACVLWCPSGAKIHFHAEFHGRMHKQKGAA